MVALAHRDSTKCVSTSGHPCSRRSNSTPSTAPVAPVMPTMIRFISKSLSLIDMRLLSAPPECPYDEAAQHVREPSGAPFDVARNNVTTLTGLAHPYWWEARSASRRVDQPSVEKAVIGPRITATNSRVPCAADWDWRQDGMR